MSDDIGLIRTVYAPAEAVQEGTIKVDVRWGTAAALDEDLNACLHLKSSAGEIVQSHCETLDSILPSSSWEANEVVRSFYIMPIGELLEEGEYTLTLALYSNSSGENVGQPATLGNVYVAPFQPQFSAGAVWGDIIRLEGYDIEQTTDALQIALYWRGEQNMPLQNVPSGNYELWVGLYNELTGVRLEVSSDGGLQAADGSVLLTDVQR
jgi:hypothetical protein